MIHQEESEFTYLDVSIVCIDHLKSRLLNVKGQNSWLVRLESVDMILARGSNHYIYRNL